MPEPSNDVASIVRGARTWSGQQEATRESKGGVAATCVPTREERGLLGPRLDLSRLVSERDVHGLGKHRSCYGIEMHSLDWGGGGLREEGEGEGAPITAPRGICSVQLVEPRRIHDENSMKEKSLALHDGAAKRKRSVGLEEDPRRDHGSEYDMDTRVL